MAAGGAVAGAALWLPGWSKGSWSHCPSHLTSLTLRRPPAAGAGAESDAETERRVDRWLEADLEKFEAFLAKEVIPAGG